MEVWRTLANEHLTLMPVISGAERKNPRTEQLELTKATEAFKPFPTCLSLLTSRGGLKRPGHRVGLFRPAQGEGRGCGGFHEEDFVDVALRLKELNGGTRGLPKFCSGWLPLSAIQRADVLFSGRRGKKKASVEALNSLEAFILGRSHQRSERFKGFGLKLHGFRNTRT